MDDLVKLVFASSFFCLFYSMVGKYIRNNLNLTDPMVTMAYGILIGHHGLSLLKTHYVYSKVIVLNFSKLVLCLQTMTIALKIPQGYIKQNFRVLFHLILTIGILKCICTFLLIQSTSYFNASAAWALGAALTPTDPILSSSIVKGEFSKKNVPEKLKLLLNAESGINDGIGILLLHISLDILRHIKTEQSFIKIFKQGIKLFISEYFLKTICVKLILSGIIGASLGFLTQKIAKCSYKWQLINTDILLVHTCALSALCWSIMTFIDGSELICIFFCGIYLNTDEWYNNTKISDVIENAFTNSLFVFLGSRIDFNRLSPRIFIVCFLSLFIRPILVFICAQLLKYPDYNYSAIENNSTDIPLTQSLKKESLFVGWFGPVGVGALYYSLLYDCKVEALTVDYAMCAVFLSVFIHGFSVPFYILITTISRHFICGI